jgi:hypothetical protein
MDATMFFASSLSVKYLVLKGRKMTPLDVNNGLLHNIIFVERV